MTRVAITGAFGFIGTHVVSALSKRGYEVHGLTRRVIPGRHSEHIRVHVIDLMDATATRKLMDDLQPTGLIHLAWDTVHGAYWNSASNLDWLSASLQLLRCFVASGGRRVLLVGSSAEYSWDGAGELHEYLSVGKPSTLYGISKKSLNEVAEKYATTCGVSYASARLFNVFGPGENRSRLIPRVICTLLQNGRLEFDSGTNVGDFLHVSDVADALAALYESHVEGVVNIGSGEKVPIKDIVLTISEYLKATDRVDLTVEPNRVLQVNTVVPSTIRLRTEVGWLHNKGLRERLHETCDWWLDSLPK